MKRRILYIGSNLSHARFTANYMAFLGKMLREEGYEVKQASGKKNRLLRWYDIFSLVHQNRSRTDLVLIDTYGSRNFYYSFATGQLCQWLKQPYIALLHGGSLPKRIAFSPFASRNFFGRARFNIAPSEYLEGEFRAAGFQNLQIIANALQLKEYPFKARHAFQPRLLWVRRFEKMYNPLMALEVFEKLLQTYPEAELCMVGPENDGSLMKCKKVAADKGLPVRFTGRLGKREWIELSRNYDFFINTTTVDNMPISVMEAMALGLVVVSTNVGGMPYMLEDGKEGILVPTEDVAAMTTALEDLLEHQEMTRNLCHAARARVAQYDWERVRERWEEVLEISCLFQAPTKGRDNERIGEVKLP